MSMDKTKKLSNQEETALDIKVEEWFRLMLEIVEYKRQTKGSEKNRNLSCGIGLELNSNKKVVNKRKIA